LLPVTMMLFAWKAAVFPAWGSGLLCVATAIIVSHLMLPFSRISWPLKGVLSLSAAIIVAGVVFGGFRLFGLELPRRPFDLERANLSGQRFQSQDFRGANLSGANLTGAKLSDADLSRADLSHADLSRRRARVGGQTREWGADARGRDGDVRQELGGEMTCQPGS
jgi:Pentapeptide repeats (8 copies)